MRRRILPIFIALAVGVSSTFTAYGYTDSISPDNSHMRIFTPYHSVKSVFNILETSSDSQSLLLQNQVTSDDIELIARVVYAESQGEPFEGKVGVASVILNRLNHPSFPKSVKDVIYQKNAFSCVINGNLTSEPDNESYKAVDEALKGKDPTGKAVFFYNPKTASSRWIKNASKETAVTIGQHVFFR